MLINPINAALERVSGLDTALTVKWNLFDKHRFTWATSYTRVLSRRRRQFESDAERDYLHALDNVDWPDKLISNLAWSVGRWTSNLQVERYGRVPNAAQTAFITPISYANASTEFRFGEQASVAIIVNNVLDKIKNDPSFGWPFYPAAAALRVHQQQSL